jgi:hypothetical protein
MITYVSRNCDCCGKEYNVRPIDLQRGWGKHCSKECAAVTRSRMRFEGATKKLYLQLSKKFENKLTFPGQVPITANTEIQLICKKHGSFVSSLQKVSNNDEPCIKCAYDKRRQKIIDGKKQCTKCGQQKEVEHFYVLKSKDRLSEQCKECSRERGKTANRDAEKRKASGNRFAWKKRTEEILDKNISSPISISKCEYCSKVINKKGVNPKRFCSAECGKKYRADTRRGKPLNRTTKEYQCKKCNTTFVGKAPGHCFTCKYELYKIIHRAHNKARNIRLKKVFVQKVVDLKVFERDKWTCKQCNCKVQKVDIYKDNAAELDHIVPVSLGGPHSYSNVQTLCRKCNQQKSNNFNGQLVMNI